MQIIHVVAARRAGGGPTVPVFVTAAGAVLTESSEILRWADGRVTAGRRLYPDGELGAQAAALEGWLDEGLGRDGRLWMYHETLPAVDALAPWALAGVPGWERRAFRLARPLVDRVIRRHLRIDDRTAAAARERADRVFDDIATRLSDGRRFLLGERFTAADLTFAALAAPMLLPDRYGSPLPPPAAMPTAMSREVLRLRTHPAGVFADRLYAEERPVTAGRIRRAP